MLGLLKGMGKAYKEAQKAKKADKLYQSKRTDKYSGNVTDPDTIKLNKQLKTKIVMPLDGLFSRAGTSTYSYSYS